jgi:hypothetical protein
MPKIYLKLSAICLLAAATVSLSVTARAADSETPRISRSRVAAAGPYCQDLWRCGPGGCNWYHVCTRPCPDRYSCSPLYGAYGPYGGVGYWGAYTDSGWPASR